MTDLLEKAVEAVRRLAPEAQDEIARAMLKLAEDEEESEPIDPEDLAPWPMPTVVSSQAMQRSKPPFAALTREATLYATGCL